MVSSDLKKKIDCETKTIVHLHSNTHMYFGHQDRVKAAGDLPQSRACSVKANLWNIWYQARKY